MNKNFIQTLTKYDYYAFIIFLIGYFISLFDNIVNGIFTIIFSNFPIYITICFNLLYIFLTYFILKTLIKKSNLFKVTSFENKIQTIYIYLKIFFIASFLGFISNIGNVFISIIFEYILKK